MNMHSGILLPIYIPMGLKQSHHHPCISCVWTVLGLHESTHQRHQMLNVVTTMSELRPRKWMLLLLLPYLSVHGHLPGGWLLSGARELGDSTVDHEIGPCVLGRGCSCKAWTKPHSTVSL